MKDRNGYDRNRYEVTMPDLKTTFGIEVHEFEHPGGLWVLFKVAPPEIPSWMSADYPDGKSIVELRQANKFPDRSDPWSYREVSIVHSYGLNFSEAALAIIALLPRGGEIRVNNPAYVRLLAQYLANPAKSWLEVCPRLNVIQKDGKQS